MSDAPRTRLRRLDGVLLLDKPAAVSSNAALQRAKALYRAEKAGHAGTLDPLATGLLPILFGEATKFSQGLLEADKAYLATIEFGAETTTGDAEGDVVYSAPVRFERNDLERALESFVGELKQVPPMYSALKHAGKPLYELARRGIEIERKARRVSVFALTLDAWDGRRAEITLACSKGFYVRALALDLGRLLGCGAHLVALRRTRVGDFRLDEAVTLDVLETLAMPQRDAKLKPTDALLGRFPPLRLEAARARRLRQGQAIEWQGAAGLVRLYDDRGFFGLGEASGGRLRPYRLMSARACEENLG
ncbi:MAG: tRNA pseudouridine(55) synthase TruB [Rhodocyclaceae bacterium]|nr:tRNA pseudouridine(55) synthase TruB [Rhodocyclaceae bacterium]